ncbi:MAG: hypothetical protein ACI4RD_07445 [Kiritimatiellia bacterium]
MSRVMVVRGRSKVLVKTAVFTHIAVVFLILFAVRECTQSIGMVRVLLPIYLIASARVYCLMDWGRMIHKGKTVELCRCWIWKLCGKILDVVFLLLHLRLVGCFWECVEGKGALQYFFMSFAIVHLLMHCLLYVCILGGSRKGRL